MPGLRLSAFPSGLLANSENRSPARSLVIAGGCGGALVALGLLAVPGFEKLAPIVSIVVLALYREPPPPQRDALGDFEGHLALMAQTDRALRDIEDAQELVRHALERADLVELRAGSGKNARLAAADVRQEATDFLETFMAYMGMQDADGPRPSLAEVQTCMKQMDSALDILSEHMREDDD